MSQELNAPPLTVGVDQGVNLKALRSLQRDGRVRLVQAHSLEQKFKQVADQGRAFRIGMSAIGGPDGLAGDNVYAVEALLSKAGFADIEHVYASWLNKNDYFITENVDDFIRQGRRELLEQLLPGLKIRTTGEFLREIDSGAA